MRGRKQKRRSWVLLFAAGLFVAGLCTNAVGQNTAITDPDITNAIETDLFVDDAVSSHLIDVTTDQGIVTLSGSVNDLMQKDRARKIAESIKGVRSIINLVKVRPVDRKDNEIKADVERALMWDPATDSYEVKVRVDNGVVTLTGRVDSWAEKQLSAEVAKSVRGITDVKNNIEIVYAKSRLDSEIKADIERLLESNPYVNEQLITVIVEDEKAKLTGTVGSVREQNVAENIAWLTGVSSVDISDLRIELWAKDTMQKNIVNAKSDEEIEALIKDTFRYDPRVYSYDIDVDCEYGVVTLSGVVDNYMAKKAAAIDAMNSKGVSIVNNKIKVRPEYGPTDTEIAARIRSALLWDPVVDRYEITTVVRNKKAYLSGEVASIYEKERAEDVASRIDGVVDVQNNISVLVAWIWKSDQQIKQDIENQFFWSWILENADVSVDVQDGIATLSGSVDDWQEVYSAIANAFDGGAKVVKSRIKVNGRDDFFPIYHYRSYYDWPDAVGPIQYTTD